MSRWEMRLSPYAARIRAHLEENQGTASAQRAGITGGAHLH